MYTVHKRVLDPKPTQDGNYLIERFHLPANCKMLTAHVQGNEICIWYELEDGHPYDWEVSIAVVPTGGEIPFGFTYINTAFVGPTVWHVYFRYGR